jgi:outer membrane immunogenic protein
MRRYTFVFLAAACLGLAAVQNAWAADLSRPVYKAPPGPVIAPYSWTGFYLGANVGYGWGRASATVAGFTDSIDLDGIVYGGQVGYNYQFFGNWVAGIEFDFQGTSQKHDFADPSGTLVGSNTIPWFGTLRGRIGYAFADRWLLYFTGGGGYGEFKTEGTLAGVPFSAKKDEWFWALGGGVEAALWGNWTGRVEYLYLDTGDLNQTVLGVPVTTRFKDNIVRGAINYRF